jgi:hypothetical protein
MHSTEKEIWKKGINFKPFRDSVNNTSAIIAMMKQKVDKTPLIAFPVNNYESSFSQFKKIFDENSVKFIDGIPDRIKQAQAQGMEVYLNNGHFNEIGNLICGQALVDSLKNFSYN